MHLVNIITSINNQKNIKNIIFSLNKKNIYKEKYLMLDILQTGWYIEPPIDFEHKQYILLNYLQKVDSSFMNKKLSPYFLNLEKIRNELNIFKTTYNDFKLNLEKQRYLYFEDNSKIRGLENDVIFEVLEIVDFSIPQIDVRIDLGKKILIRNKQLLY